MNYKLHNHWLQFNPAADSPELTSMFARVDVAFTIIFLTELIINLAAHWFLFVFFASYHTCTCVYICVFVYIHTCIFPHCMSFVCWHTSVYIEAFEYICAHDMI